MVVLGLIGFAAQAEMVQKRTRALQALMQGVGRTTTRDQQGLGGQDADRCRKPAPHGRKAASCGEA
jgi:hypothetical protein